MLSTGNSYLWKVKQENIIITEKVKREILEASKSLYNAYCISKEE